MNSETLPEVKIVKDALLKLYSTSNIVRVKFKCPTNCRVAVLYDGSSPSKSDVQQMQELVTKMINEDNALHGINIRILRFNHRPKKKELEVCFEFPQVETEKAEKRSMILKPDNIENVSEKIFDLYMSVIHLDKGSLREDLLKKTSAILTSLKNEAYTNGYIARDF